MTRRFALSLASLAVVLLTAGPAAAWETRVLTLGDQNRYVEDDANIWIYPQKTVNYGDRFYLDLARKEGRVIDSDGETEGTESVTATNANAPTDSKLKDANLNGGFILEIAESLHLAFWASQYTDLVTHHYLTAVQEAQLDPTGCGQAVGESGANRCGLMSEQQGVNGDGLRGYTNGANRKLDFFLGWRIAPTFDLGAHLWYGSGLLDYYQTDSIEAGNGQKRGSSQYTKYFTNRQVGIGLGTSVGLFSDAVLDAGLRFSNYAYSMDENNVTMPAVDGGNAISLDSRMSTRMSKYWYLVPALQFNYTSFTGEVTNAIAANPGADTDTRLGLSATTINWSDVDIDLGLGMQMRVPGKANLFTSFGLSWEKNTYSGENNDAGDVLQTIEYTTFQLPYWRTGFEAPLFSWLDFRAGFVKRWGTWRRHMTYTDGGIKATNDERKRRAESHEQDVTYSIDAAAGDNVKAKYPGAVLPTDFETFVGSTMHYQGWNFAVELDPNFLFHGPFNTFVGSNADGTTSADGDKPWFGRFEISYLF